MSQVFISYSRQNLDFVQDLAKRLRRRNYRVWMDKSDIRPGTNWQEAISKAVKASAAVIAVISPASIKSEWVGIEVDEALDMGRQVIPYCYERCDLPLRLKKQNAIFHDEEGAFEKLVEALPRSAHIHASPIVEQNCIGRSDITFAQAADGLENALHDLHLMVGDQRVDLIGLPLIPTRYCATYLVGRADDTLEWQPQAQLGIQLAQTYPGDHFPTGIAAHFIKPENLDFKLRLLLVRGPLRIDLNQRGTYDAAYGLDPDEMDEWSDVVSAVKVALSVYEKGTQHPDLQIFALGPGVILYRLGEVHREYIRTELYQLVPGRKEYVQVL